MAGLLAALQAGDVRQFHFILDTEGLPPRPYDYRLLEKALLYKRIDIAKLLIHYGCTADIPAFRGNSPLHLAICNGCDYDFIEGLLMRGAVVNRADARGETPLHAAFENQADDMIVDLLLHAHLSTFGRNETNESGLTYLHIAASRPHAGFIERLIERGNADIDCQVHSDAESLYAGYTPLHMAIEFGQSDIAELLLNCGADINIQNVNGSTPLHLALERRDEDFIQLLFAYDLERRNVVNRFGLSHFMAACACSNTLVVSNFLDNLTNGTSNLDVNEIVSSPSSYSFKGYTPLHIAVEYGCIDNVRLLLANGARLSPTYQGLILENVANKNEFYDIARLIQLHGQNYELYEYESCDCANNAFDFKMDWSS